MTTMAYSGYDNFGRSISRRQSLAYSPTPMAYSPHGAYTVGEVSDVGLADFVIF